MDRTPFKKEVVEVDFCVVGGGIAGMLAAIAAARRGATVALMQDRPVLGGNASSEIRMWICGCSGRNLHETGIIEDLQLDNCYYNPDRNFSIWDSILYGAVRYEPGIALFLNCSCNAAEMDGDRIVSVTGWQTTTQKWIEVKAKLFADCSGDSVLAPLTGAEFRVGREARAEFGESLEREEADRRTMGMSCLIQARETTSPQPYTPPPWANKYPSDSDLKPGIGDFAPGGNYWWLELGGMQDSIADTEEVRDELLRVAFGLWDHYKNHGDHKAENWALDWVGFLPGKRESRRYVGDYILTQPDIESLKKFDDIAAYGGWPLDDHDPHGFEGDTPSNIAIRIKNPPYGIPYRSLYSRNVSNLFFAGRNISVTHAALSSTRVMCTCGIIGQAVGTAAALATKYGTTPRGVYEGHVRELQQALLDDDCYLPGVPREIAPLSRRGRLVASEGDPSNLLNGIDRPVGDAGNDFVVPLGGFVAYEFDAPETVADVRLVFDSDTSRWDASKYNIRSNYAIKYKRQQLPETLVRDFRVEVRDAAGAWRTVARVTDNRRRMVKIAVGAEATAVRVVPETTWGAAGCRLFAFDAR